VVLMAHDYRGLPIARAENIKKTDNGITSDVVFPDEGVYPLADTVYRLYKDKFMRAWSIGFIPMKTEDIEDEKGKDEEDHIRRGKRIKTSELLEYSGCTVPSNPEALTNMMAKGINIDTLKEAGFIEIEDEIINEKIDEKAIEEEKQSDELFELDEEIKEGGYVTDEKSGYLTEENSYVINKELEKEIVLKPEETEAFIHIPVRSAGDFVKDSFRTIDIDAKKGIKAVIGKLKSDPQGSTKTQKFIFDKSKGWTLESARQWVKDHNKEYEDIDLDEPFLTEEKEEKGEGSDADEVIKGKDNKEYDALIKSLEDMILALNVSEVIKENKELKEKVDKLEKENKELELKAGAVLNKRNKQDLKDAQNKIQNVLDSAEPIVEDSLEIEDTKEVIEDNIVIDLGTDTVDDPPIVEEKDEDTFEVDEAIIKDMIDSKFDFVVGRIDKKNERK